MKVSIIGGGGLVGSCAGFALQCGGVASEIALLDVNADLAAGQALDIMHGAPSVADQVISWGAYEHIPDSDVICITAGLRRKPDESRLDLINRNTDLFVQILEQLKSAGVKPTAKVVVVSNPVDILTYVACQAAGTARESSDWSGNAARHHPLLQFDLARVEGTRHADKSPDTWRAWRKHGSHLVECDHWWIAAGEISQLDDQHGQPDFCASQGFRCRNAEQEGWSWLCSGNCHPRCD